MLHIYHLINLPFGAEVAENFLHGHYLVCISLVCIDNVHTHFPVAVPIYLIFNNVLNNEIGKCNMNKLSFK